MTNFALATTSSPLAYSSSNPIHPARSPSSASGTAPVPQALHSAADTGPQTAYGLLTTQEFDDSLPHIPRSDRIRFEHISPRSILKAGITHRAARKAVLAYLQATRELTDDVLEDIVRDPGKTIATLYDDLYKDPAFPPKTVPNEWAAVDASHADQLEQLMQYVSEDEVAPESRMPMLRGLLKRLVELPQEPSTFSIASYDFLAGGVVFKQVHLIRKEFEQHLAKTFPSLAESPGAAHWLATQLLERFDPVMLNPQLEDFWYGSPQYCSLKADIAVITSAKLYQPMLDGETWDLKEIHRTADYIRDVLGGNPSGRLAAIQSDAALLYAHTRRTANGERLLALNGPASPDDYGVALRAFGDMQIEWRRMPYKPLEKAIGTLNMPPPMGEAAVVSGFRQTPSRVPHRACERFMKSLTDRARRSSPFRAAERYGKHTERRGQTQGLDIQQIERRDRDRPRRRNPALPHVAVQCRKSHRTYRS